jgi:hypothetical protein
VNNKSRAVLKRDGFHRLLSVEGKNDLHVLWSLLEHHNIPQTFEIEDMGGIVNLLEAFEVAIDQAGLERLGIMIDADTDLDARWLSIRNILLTHHYGDVPQNPDSNSTIIRQEGLPIVGIWIMPDNKIPGYLEDFVSFLVPSGNVLWPMTDEAIQKVKLVEAGVRFKDYRLHAGGDVLPGK